MNGVRDFLIHEMCCQTKRCAMFDLDVGYALISSKVGIDEDVD